MENHADGQKEKKSQVSFANLAAEQKKNVGGNTSEAELKFTTMDTSRASGATGSGQSRNNSETYCKTIYDRAVSFVNQSYDAARAGHGLELNEGIEIVGQIINSGLTPDFLFIMALHLEYDSRYIYHHPVNVAILAVRLGHTIGLNLQELTELGLAALLHDIGSVRIAESILNKASAFSQKEKEDIKQRPKHSYEILQAYKNDHPYLSATAIAVYERVDGSGYPMGLQQDEIPAYAHIIGLVDVYEALIHNRPQRNKFLSFPAIKEIIRDSKNCFHRGYLKAFINSFSIFPIYSYVRLNSGAIGRVIESHPDHPMRPKLQVIYDSQERRVLIDRIIDLPENPLLYITDSVEDNEIQEVTRS